MIESHPNPRNAEVAKRIRALVKEHHKWRRGCINLLAAENVSSPTVREIVSSDFMHRYSEYENHDIEKRWDEGGRYVIEVERLGVELAKKLFQAKHVDLRPISGHLAIMSAVCAFTRPGAVSLEVSGKNGGHEWYCLAKNNPAINYKPDWIPFDRVEWNIDVDAANRKIRESKPSVIILGSSFYLFPHPTAELREAANEVGAKIAYDGAHVLGLIAGGQWPNALNRGADVLTGSTHKTFPGPQKGLIATNSDEWKTIANSVYPSFLTNHHLMNVAAFAYAMAEYMEFGEAYAKQVVQNAKSLAQSLSDEGFDVVGENKGFTQSHQVLVRTDGLMSPSDAAKSLDRANIVCNKMELEGALGLRLGTSEVTRLGMKQSDMREIARFIKEIVIEGQDSARIGSKVEEFTTGFRSLCYSFDAGADPYEYFEFPPAT